jgi:hypothetical protein
MTAHARIRAKQNFAIVSRGVVNLNLEASTQEQVPDFMFERGFSVGPLQRVDVTRVASLSYIIWSVIQELCQYGDYIAHAAANRHFMLEH